LELVGDNSILLAMFVIAIVVGEKAFGALFTSPPRPVRVAAGYLIGTSSTMWLIGAPRQFLELRHRRASIGTSACFGSEVRFPSIIFAPGKARRGSLLPVRSKCPKSVACMIPG